MSVWVVGDVQGCAATFKALRKALDRAPDDVVLGVGDLVNRGPDNLRVLRWFANHGDSVLGNHDVYLLARAAGLPPKGRDTLADVLESPARDTLIDWLRYRPLLLEVGPWVVVHAGLAPAWTLADARAAARGAEAILRGPDWAAAVLQLYREPEASPLAEPLAWLTRVRMVRPDGSADGYAGTPAGALTGLRHWAQVSRAIDQGAQVIYGHWAAQGHVLRPQTVALDSGCVWGRALTAYRVDDGRVVQVPCRDPIGG